MAVSTVGGSRIFNREGGRGYTNRMCGKFELAVMMSEVDMPPRGVEMSR